MIRQVFVIKGDEIIYQRIFGNALSKENVENLRFKIKQDTIKESEKSIGYFDFYKYRVAYIIELELDLIFIIITGLVDDFFRLIQPILNNFKDEFLKLFGDDIKDKNLDSEKIKILDLVLDSMHNEIKPKISVVGFSGVGKTTIKNLIKSGEVPLQHIPTISGDIATIKIGKLQFSLFDFAGQEQYKYLWKGFIKGSNAVIVVTDSTPINVEKSRYFISLRNDEAPYAQIAVIGNKQDLSHSMIVKNIENILGLKTYPMVANSSDNREKMIQIIADILDMSIYSSPLMEGTIDKENLEQFQNTEAETETVLDFDIAEEKFGNVKLDPNLLDEVINDIKGVKVENILRNHLKIINSTLKVLNNNEELTFEEFYKNYQDYVKKEFICRNIALKQFLETQFSLLKKSVEEDKFIAIKLKDDKDVIINALLCAYLSQSYPYKFPIFEKLSNLSIFSGFDAQTVKEIHAYYLRIMNKIGK